MGHLHRVRGTLALLSCLATVLAMAPVARATYPGAAGELAWQESSTTTIENDNGATQVLDSLFTLPGAGRITSPLSCTFFVGGMPGAADCPLSAPEFSADGRLVVFSGLVFTQAPSGPVPPGQSDCSAGCGPDLIVAGADGSAPRVVPIPLRGVRAPEFIGDQSLVFSAPGGRGQPAQLFTVQIDGSGLRQLTTSGGSEPAPCADGSIAFVRRGALMLRSTNGALTQLAGRGAGFPDCSRDSRTIAFIERSELYTVSRNAKHLRRISPATAARGCLIGGCIVGRPAFSPAGGRIAVTVERFCGSTCRGHGSIQCRAIGESLAEFDLRGRELLHRRFNINSCQPDFGSSNDVIGGVAWQPLTAPTGYYARS